MGLELLPQLVGGVVGVADDLLVGAGWACAGLRGKRHEKGKYVFCNINTKTITCLACAGLVGCEMAILGCFCVEREWEARRRRRNFSKVDFTPFPGPVWLKPLRKRTQRAEKHFLVKFERHLGVAMRLIGVSAIFL